MNRDEGKSSEIGYVALKSDSYIFCLISAGLSVMAVLTDAS